MINAFVSDRSVRMDGHAPKEQGTTADLVCAAASALVYASKDALEALSGCGIQNYSHEHGHVSFDVEGRTEASLLLLRALVIGLEGIRDSYPGTIRICCSGL